jgi:vitamin B12 transporter
MRKICSLGLPLLAVAMPAWAQAPTRTFASLEGCCTTTIVVEGSGLPNPLVDEAYSIQNIILYDNPFERIENIVAGIPGFQQFRRSDARSANPTSQGITVRGLGGSASSRVLLLLDGVPQGDPFGGWISWPGYDALNLNSLRAKRGGGSGVDGSGALAGTLDFFSDNTGDDLEIDGEFGSRNSIGSKLRFGRNLGNGYLSVSGSYARGDGFIPIIESQRGAVDRKAPYEQGGIAIRAVAPLSADTELQASIRGFTDKRDRGFDFSDNQNSGVDASLRLVNRAFDGWQWSALGYVQIRDFASRFGSIAAGRASVAPVLDQYSVPSTGLGARFEIRPPVGDAAELRIGGDWRRTIGETNEDFFSQDWCRDGTGAPVARLTHLVPLPKRALSRPMD